MAGDVDLSSVSDDVLRREIVRRDAAKAAALIAQQYARAKYFCPDCGGPDSWHTRDCPTDTSE